RTLRSFYFKIRFLVFLPEIMTVITNDTTLCDLIIIHDHGGPGGGQIHHFGMFYRTCVYLPRIASKTSDQVNVVNAMIQDLHPRQIIEELPQMPWGVNAYFYFIIIYLAYLTTVYQMACGDRIWCVSQLKIDSRDKAFILTNLQDTS